MSSFAVDLAKFAKKATARTDEAVRQIVVGIAAEIDMRSPVGDAKYWISPPPRGYTGGHFRANWQLGVGKPPVGEIHGVDKSGGKTQGHIRASIPAKAAGKVYFLANNAPYANRLEDGWSRQAPQGIVGITVVRFQQIVDEALSRLPK